MKLTILYKTSLSEQRLKKYQNRPYCQSTEQMVLICLVSILKQMNDSDNIVFFCDGDNNLEKIHKLCNYYKVKYNIKTFNYNSASKIDNECRDYIHANDNLESIYICEDDYLHLDGALGKIKSFLTLYPDCFCHPTDYPNLYEQDVRFKYMSDIIIADNHHWRSIKNTTYTIAFTKQLFDQNYNTFKIIEGYVWDEHGINLLYVFNKCYSPIPSLTSHLTPHCIPYCVDTESIFAETLSQLKSISL